MKNAYFCRNTMLACMLFASFTGTVRAADEANLPLAYEECTVFKDKTEFSLFSPKATAVSLQLYSDDRSGSPSDVLEMRKKDGLWKVVVNKALQGLFYTFKVTVKGAAPLETSGYMAKATGVNGNRAAIIDAQKATPLNWSADIRPTLKKNTEMLVYRLNLREFTLGEQSGILQKGKFLGLSQEGSTNKNAFSTGLSHLTDLGITHVLLLPVYDFDNDDESRPRLPVRYTRYTAKNPCVPEGSYATKPFDPISRVLEFRQMVQTLHKKGLRVLMEVEVDAEWLIPVLTSWVNNYHIDGFYLHHSGDLSIETVQAARLALSALNPALFLALDGVSTGAGNLTETQRATTNKQMLLPDLVFANPTLENTLCGNPADSLSRGFIHGNFDAEAFLRFCIAGGIRHPQVNAANAVGFRVNYASSPTSVFQSISTSLGMTVYDHLLSGNKRSDTPESFIRRYQLALSILFTSQGIPLLQSGDEMMYSRGGISGFETMPDSICRLNWRNKTYYHNVYEFAYGLSQLRKNHPAFRMEKDEDIRQNLKFLEGVPKGVSAYLLDNNAGGDSWKTIVVIHNATDDPAFVDIPAGKWKSVVQDGVVNPLGIAFINGSKAEVKPLTTLVAYLP